MQKLSVKQAKVYNLEEEKFKQNLSALSSNLISKKIIYFPDESGKIEGFEVIESSVFSEELARKYPQIKSYRGTGVNDASKRIRFSISQKGMQSMLIDADDSVATFMQKTQDGDYIMYSRKSYDVIDKDFICETKDALLSSIGSPIPSLVDSQILRKYRVAISATGEYTQYHGGTKADALAAINATLTRINMVFETDLAVTLELVANTDLVIYTDAATDPYSGNLNAEVQSTFNSVIGAANYDIGHLLNKDTNGGDAGFVGAVCVDAKKGSAYSSGVTPEGDLFDIDFVAHEMGHQLGANHTWSFESEGTQVQAEPGSGSTIMGYAGIVGVNNVASSGQDYFHYNSIKQIISYLETTNCATEIPIANNPPVIVATPDYVIPKGTAFVLNGNATDDASDVLTYTWEQIDDGVVTNTSFGPDNPSGANFRSQKPTTIPDRYFPKLSSIIQGNLTQTNPTVNSAWETVSNVEREMNFALTVRDNVSGGGQVTSDEVKVNVMNNSGPFVVLSQDTNFTYVGGSIQEVSWDVANTHNAPINAQKVDILLSIDGGLSFPFVVANDIPNDGSHSVLIPGEVTSQARFMVKAADNIFLAVNTSNFTIGTSEVILNFSSLDFDICQPSDLVVPFIYETDLVFSETSTFSISGLPAGLTAAFSQPTAAANNTSISITFSNTGAVSGGVYPITVTSTSLSVTKSITINLAIYNTSFGTVNLTSPADGVTNGELSQLFEWNEEPSSTSYDIEIATDISFTTILESATVLFNSYRSVGLIQETVYYWRVKPKNSCGEGVFGSVFSFTTKVVGCKSVDGIGFPISISSSGTPTIFSTIAFDEDLPIADVKVVLNVTHTYLADLTIKLTSPQGTTVVLVSNSCGDTRNINATFDASAPSFVCDDNPAISGVVRPLGALASFDGESSLGNWILEINDNAGGDGGSLNNFALELCVEGEFRPDDDNDGVFDDGDDLCLGTPDGQEVNVNGCPVYRFESANFSVALDSESCRDNDDGAIRIMASTAMNYTVTVAGSGVAITSNFTDAYTLDGLMAGDYTVCISGTDGVITYEEYCLNAVITQPDELQVDSSLSADGKSVTLNLNGAAMYIIALNGAVTQTESNAITLDFENGSNTLKVNTNLVCQGTFEQTFIVADKPFLYPNPAETNANIFTGIENVNCVVRIYAMNGKLVKEISYINTMLQLQLDVNDLPVGIYIIKLVGDNLKETFKLVKI